MLLTLPRSISRRSARAAGLAAAPVAIAMAVRWTFGGSLSSYLIDDDFQWLAGAMEFSWGRLFDISDRTHFYRPVVELHFAAVYALSGCSAPALHAASLALHALNATLAMALAYSVTASMPFAVLSALLFAVQPAPAEAVLWPSAASALLSASFGLGMLLVGWKPDPRPGRWRKYAVATLFAGALGSHESAVMLPVVLWLLRCGAGERERPAKLARELWPSLVVLAMYLALTAWINSRNYVVTEGRYAIGPHVVENLWKYFVSLWVGRRVALDYALTTAVLVALLWKGSDRARAWTIWLVAALLPMLPFAGPTTSRYTYMAAVPFTWLVSAGILAAHRFIAGRPVVPVSGTAAAAAAVAVLLAGFTFARSATFARKGTRGFHADAVPYRELAGSLQQQPGPDLRVNSAAVAWLNRQYLLPLARAARCDPRVTVDAVEREP